ncbi:unnamed protein product [Choristocarpus tenellus]
MTTLSKHITGERNCWGDLLSRWTDVPAVAVRAITVSPDVQGVHEAQLAAI